MLADDLRDNYNDLKNVINYQIVDYNTDISQYFYKKDTYIYTTGIDADGVETSLSGYDLYKVPVVAGEMVLIKQISGSEQYFYGLNSNYIIHFLIDNEYKRIYLAGNGSHPNYFFTGFDSTQSQFKIAVTSEIEAVLFCVKRGNEKFVIVQRNIPKQVLNDLEKISFRNTIVTVDDTNSMVSNIYKLPSGMNVINTTGYSIRSYYLKQGDIINIPSKSTAINYYGFFFDSSTQVSSVITSTYFTAPHDGIVDTFVYTSDDITITVYPAKSIEIDYSHIKNIPESQIINPFDGLDAVAFGTSLTYRSQSTQGYLTFLPTLSGITFDNQGVGSSTILTYSSLPQMLPVVKNYASYSGKHVVILEGFVNDWYYNSDRLGTWTDNTENTVCGCVRSALNYILSQNANATIFLVLDHYGKLVGSVDCSSTIIRGTGLPTQFEFYEEIAKVAESLGIPVIKQYAISGISENTPQYLADNIHPTMLGAKQSAHVIWEVMKQYFPNQISI